MVMRDRPGRPHGQLWLMDLATQKSSRIGGEKDSGGSPLWSPDGKWLAFQGSQGDKHGVFVARADGPDVTFLPSMSGPNNPPPRAARQGTSSPPPNQNPFISSPPT